MEAEAETFEKLSGWLQSGWEHRNGYSPGFLRQWSDFRNVGTFSQGIFYP